MKLKVEKDGKTEIIVKETRVVVIKPNQIKAKQLIKATEWNTYIGILGVITFIIGASIHLIVGKGPLQSLAERGLIVGLVCIATSLLMNQVYAVMASTWTTIIVAGIIVIIVICFAARNFDLKLKVVKALNLQS